MIYIYKTYFCTLLSSFSDTYCNRRPKSCKTSSNTCWHTYSCTCLSNKYVVWVWSKVRLS